MKVSAFKQQVKQEWAGRETAAAWQKHYPQMRVQMADVTNAFVGAAQPEPGMRILDLASGNGEPALSLARRVVPNGRVTATDVNEAMLSALRANAVADGVANIETKVCDAHQLPFADETFDLATSRFGVMFFADTRAALREIKRVLKPGGRVTLLVWGPPAPGTYFGAAAMPFMRRLAVKPDPDGPSPMRFAQSRKLATLLDEVGLAEVDERSTTLPAAYRGTPRDLLTAMMEIAAPLRNAAAGLSDEERAAAEREALNNLSAVYDGKVTNVTAPVIVVTGRRS
ncbi:MAG: class I SAM-dependent methyltransferase [Vicinamibacterales bacterium]